MVDKPQFESIYRVLGAETAGLVQMFEQSGTEQLCRARQLLQQGQAAEAAECLHRIKGSGSYLGAALLGERCAALMQQLRASPESASEALLDELDRCFSATIRDLQRLTQPDNRRS